MSSGHDDQALAAPYALGALDASERRAFESHLATCQICLEEVRSFQRVTAALAHAVPQRTPNPTLRARVLSSITGGATPATRERSTLGLWEYWIPLAAAVVLASGLAVYALQLQNRLSTLETRLESAERRASAAERSTLEARRIADEAQTAMTVLAAPDLARIDLVGQSPAPQATARALWSRNRGMVFTTSNLPQAPPGRVYQVWVVTARAPVSAGLLTLDPSGRGTAFFQTPPDIETPLAVAVTLEPAGGVPAPTGPMYLVGKPGSAI